MILFYAFFSLAVIYYTIDHRSYTYLRLIKQFPYHIRMCSIRAVTM